MAAVTIGLVYKAVAVLVLAALLRFFSLLYKRRMSARAISDQYGLPLLPHSFLFGHFPVVAKLMAKYPRDMDGGILPLAILREYPEYYKFGACYLDIWPISYPLMVVVHPDMMAQFCQDTSLQKHDLMAYEFAPFTQGDDLVCSEGQQWRTWRSIFNPGFSARNVQSLVPGMLEEIKVFRKWLERIAATSETVPMNKQAARLTVDIIGQAVLGTRLRTQTTKNEFYEALRRQVSRLIVDASPQTLFNKTFNPIRPFLMWRDNRIMRKICLPYIMNAIRNKDLKEGSKTINGLAVQAYLKEHSGEGEIDPRWAEIAVAQLKVFLFAGHDTTASTLSFTYALLHDNPKALSKVRDELDLVFGPDIDGVVDQIARAPEILNRLTYTTAVIKETLRMFPPVGSVRRSPKDFHLLHPETGTRLPTYGWMLFSASQVSQRHALYFPRPDEFIPERFLATEGDELYVRKNSYRPFELGPRNCVGQELAMTELRCILALTLRDLDFQPMYPADSPKPFGTQFYQVRIPEMATAHPKGSLPMRVSFRRGK